MKFISGIVAKFGGIAKNSEQSTLENMRRGNVQNESAITGRFLATLEAEINRHEVYFPRNFFPYQTAQNSGFEFHEFEEFQDGADFGIVLDINVDGFMLKKGFICQAKREQNGILIQSGRVVKRVRFQNNLEFQRL
ncbi:MAG TPA: hypothetical protein VNK44_04125 [Candidatus Nitrosotenuis sp.]|nr:hypothetical protein [Candidatus Nitrosotenuis sp.]